MAFARGYVLRGFVVVADGPASAAGVGGLCRSPQRSCVLVCWLVYSGVIVRSLV